MIWAASPTHRAENPAGHGSKEVKGKTHTYYQVLIDARDCPHIVSKQSAWAWGPLHGKDFHSFRDREGSEKTQVSPGPQGLWTG